MYITKYKAAEYFPCHEVYDNGYDIITLVCNLSEEVVFVHVYHMPIFYYNKRLKIGSLLICYIFTA